MQSRSRSISSDAGQDVETGDGSREYSSASHNNSSNGSSGDKGDSSLSIGQGADASSADSNDGKLGKANARVPVAGIIVLSVCSSVTLILVNKVVMTRYGFSFVLSLTTFHFLCTWGALSTVAHVGRVFQPATGVAVRAKLQVALAGVCSIVFMNLSLRSNTVGTYQMMKLLVVPCAMFINYTQQGTTYSAQVKMALMVLLVGVGIATVTDVELQLLGFVMGILSVVSTAQFQVWQGSKQKELGVASVQLTHLLAPYQAAITGLAALVFERDVVHHSFRGTEVLLIVISGGVAVSVNLCSMGLIGRTSAIVYQVVGHTKTCLILVGGYIVMTQLPPAMQMAKQLLGIVVALGGVGWYSYLKLYGGSS